MLLIREQVATQIMGNAMLKWPDRDPMHPAGIEKYVLKGGNTLGEGILGDPEDIAGRNLLLNF